MADNDKTSDAAAKEPEEVTAESLAARFKSHESVTTHPAEPAKSEGDEPDETTEADDETVEDAESGEPEEGAAEDTDPEEEETPEDKPERKKKSAQERIAELTKARREAERRAAELERQIAETQRQPAKQEGSEQTKDDLTSGEETAKSEDEAPKPEDFQYGEIDPGYIQALVDYRTRKTLKEEQVRAQERQQQEAAERASQEFLQKAEDTIARGASEFDDFEKVVEQGYNEGKYPLAETIVKLAVDSEVGHKVIYHLATNPKEAREIAALDPTQQAVAFGRLEARFTSSDSDAPKQNRAPQAPPPAQQARGAGGKFQVPPNTDDFRAFKKKYG